MIAVKSKFTVYLIPVLFLVPLFYGCNPDVVFEKNKSIDSKGWHYQDIREFYYSVNDTTLLHDIFLNVRNNTDYPYSNFIVFFETEFPDGRIFRDTIETQLADRTGKWTGKGFGRIKSNSFHFRKDVWFPLEGEYRFTIEQAMRQEYLQGITDMGMRIEKK